MLRYLEWAALGLTLAQVSACADTPLKPDVLTGPALTIVAGNGVSDTISATFTQGLVVNVRAADGNAAVGAYVLFNSIGAADVQVAPASDAAAPFTAGQSVPTDAQGRALVRIRFSTKAGQGRVAVSVPVFGLADTARYTILAGAATRVSLAPADTAIDVGGSVQLRAAVVDRGGNARGEALSYGSTTSAATVSPTGLVTGASPGGTTLRASASSGGRTLADSVNLVVVPAARIAVSELHGPIRLSSLTGAAERTVLTGNVNAQDWSPAGDRLVYVDDRGNGNYALSVMDTLGSSVQLPVPLSSTWPQYSADGQWIYFNVNDGSQRIERIHPDGTGLQELMQGTRVSPAPDGRVAVSTSAGIWVGDPVTKVGAVVPGTSPAEALRWAPDGQWIVYRDRAASAIVIVRPDGTGKRSFIGDIVGGLAWSPDSRWILAGDSYRLRLIDTAGAPTPGGYFLRISGLYPAWRR